ncbi:MAG: hypothetical protein JWN04_4214 [Myxococcaceae bacterium]|nr:hypothetical protein [Myxococcaceae bacterium]
MATRFSGTVTISIRYVDSVQHSPNGHYRCYLSSPVTMARRGYSVTVGAPRHLDHAVDSAEAYDAVARAAVSFAGPIADTNGGRDAQGDICDRCDWNDSEVMIFRSERARAGWKMAMLDAEEARSASQWSLSGARMLCRGGVPIFELSRYPVPSERPYGYATSPAEADDIARAIVAALNAL